MTRDEIKVGGSDLVVLRGDLSAIAMLIIKPVTAFQILGLAPSPVRIASRHFEIPR